MDELRERINFLYFSEFFKILRFHNLIEQKLGRKQIFCRKENEEKRENLCFRILWIFNFIRRNPNKSRTRMKKRNRED